jgi:hypothetical protein
VRARVRSEALSRGTARARAFAGVLPEDVECFIERSSPPDPDCLPRWKALQREGWDVEALVAEDGSTMVGLGCRYLSAARETAA